MKLQNLLFLQVAAAAALVERQTTDSANCVTEGVHVIATGGANSTDPFAYGLLVTLAQAIVNKIPGSDMVSMPYDKVNISAAGGQIRAGSQTLGRYITEYHASCPDSKIALVGYSAGATINMIGLCQGVVPQSLASNTIIASVVYGDPTRSLNAPFNAGTCTNGAGIAPRDPNGCGAFIPLLKSYCDVNDPQCCDGPPEDFEIHFTYPGIYDGTASDFVVQQFRQLGGGSAPSGSSSAVRSSTASPSPSSSAAPSPSSSSTSSSSSSSSSAIVLPTVASSTSVAPPFPTTTVVPTTAAPTATAAPSTSAPATSTLGPFNPNGGNMAAQVGNTIAMLGLPVVAGIAALL